MKHLFFALAAFLVGSVVASDVLVLDDSNFETEIKKHEIILMEFYAPWCGHCKKLAPEYDIAATKLKKNDPPIPIGKVDCTANTESCSKYGVSGYPTLKIFEKGAVLKDYDGPRQAAGIVSYMKKAASPAALVIATSEKLKSFIDNAKTTVVIGYLEDESLVSAFKSAANGLRDDYKFAYTTDAGVIEASGETKDTVKMYRPLVMKTKFEETSMLISGTPTIDGYRTFLKSHALGLCGQLTPENLKNFNRPLVVLAASAIDYTLNAKGSNYYRNRVMKWGKDFSDKVTFAVANREEIAQMLPESGLPDNQEVVVVVFDENERKFIMPTSFTADNFKSFLTSYIAGEVEAHIKSEDAPADNSGPVTVVTGKTFDKLVMDENKDVLIEFYAPWCGHCKSLEPKWNELAEKMQGNDDVVIAKMDATANDAPAQFQVSGYPTIYWAPKGGKKNPVKYQGGREVTDFVKYVKDNASPKKTEL